MKMKNIFALAVAAVMILSLAACGSSASTSAAPEAASAPTATETAAASSNEAAAPADQLANLLNSGFQLGTAGSNENGAYQYLFNADHTEFWKATFHMTDEQFDTFFNVPWDAEDHDQQVLECITSASDLAVTQLEIPDISAYTAFIGKTVGELESENCEFAYQTELEDGTQVVVFYVYVDDYTTYTLLVTPDIAADDDTFYDDDGMRALTIKNVTFYDFS